MAFRPADAYGGGPPPYPGAYDYDYDYGNGNGNGAQYGYGEYGGGTFPGHNDYNDGYDEYDAMQSPRFGAGAPPGTPGFGDLHRPMQSPRFQGGGYGGDLLKHSGGGKKPVTPSRRCMYIFGGFILVLGAVIGIVVAVNQHGNAAATSDAGNGVGAGADGR